MTLTLCALSFACGCLGAVVGVLLLFKLAKPRAQLTIDLVLKQKPLCDACGVQLGTRHCFESKASDTFPVTIKR